MRVIRFGKITSIFLIPIIILVLFVVLIPGISAEGSALSINESIGQCSVWDETGIPVVVTGTIKLKISSSQINENKTFQCEVQDFGNSTGKAITWKSDDFPNFGCIAGGDFTTVWHETITENGDLKLTCQFNNNQF